MRHTLKIRQRAPFIDPGQMLKAIVFGLALAACGQTSIPHVFAYSGSDEGFTAASAAVAEWNAVCGLDLRVERGGDGVPLEEVDAIVEAPDRGGATTIEDGAAVRIRFVANAGTSATIAHEIGHVLGLGHAERGLMAAESSDAPAPHVTADECARLR